MYTSLETQINHLQHPKIQSISEDLCIRQTTPPRCTIFQLYHFTAAARHKWHTHKIKPIGGRCCKLFRKTAAAHSQFRRTKINFQLAIRKWSSGWKALAPPHGSKKLIQKLLPLILLFGLLLSVCVCVRVLVCGTHVHNPRGAIFSASTLLILRRSPGHCPWFVIVSLN